MNFLNILLFYKSYLLNKLHFCGSDTNILEHLFILYLGDQHLLLNSIRSKNINGKIMQLKMQKIKKSKVRKKNTMILP